MDYREMKQKFIALESTGMLKNLSVTFIWGISRREYTCSNFRIEDGDVHFRQDTNTGDDAYPNNRLGNINSMFMGTLLDNILRSVAIDRNMF